jgi:hypothetical protein
MLQPNLPPESAVSQLSDLIALFRDIKRAEKWVADLSAAAEENKSALKALAEANSATAVLSEKMDKQEAALLLKGGKLEALGAELNAQKKEQAETALVLAAEKTALASAVAAHKADVLVKVAALEKLESQLLAAKAEAEADRLEAAAIKAELQEKAKAVKLALGA